MPNEDDAKLTFVPPLTSKYWEGCNVRRLKTVEEMSSVDRETFMRSALKLIDDAGKSAHKYGLSEWEAKAPIIRKLAEESLFFFTVYVIGGEDQFLNKDFVFRLCLDVQQNKWDRMWIIAREHFKTTIITQISSLWEVIRNPDLTFGIFSYKDQMAQKILLPIKSMIETNPMLYALWPKIFWKEPTQTYEIDANGNRVNFQWSTTRLQLRRQVGKTDATFEAHGIAGSSATGAHFSNLILDDCETRDNVGTPDAIEKRYQEMAMAVNTGKTGNLNMCYVGTFYAKEDAYSRMIKEGTIKEAIIQPCYDDEGNPICYTMDELSEKRRKLGSWIAWLTQMLCDPSMNSESRFDENWIKYWEPDEKNMENLNVFAFVDPASDKGGKKHDFTTIVVVAYNSLRQKMVCDIIRDKLSFDGKFNALMNMYKKWRPQVIYYEETAMASDTAHLYREMQKTNNFLPISPYSPVHMGNKTSRIEKLIFAFQNGDIFLPKYCYHQNWKGMSENVVQTCIVDELLAYPNCSHDDFMDCLATSVIFDAEGRVAIPDMPGYGSRFRKKKKEHTTYDYNAMSFAVGGDGKEGRLTATRHF